MSTETNQPNIESTVAQVIGNEPKGTMQILPWNDIVGELIIRKQGTNGTVDYTANECAVVFNPSGDFNNAGNFVPMSFQLPHNIYLYESHIHIHWEQQDAKSREFTVMWRIQNDNEAKATAWNTIVADLANTAKYPYPGGTFNQISELAILDIGNAKISSRLQFKIARTDGNAGDVLATFMDGHIQFIQFLGSRQEFAQ